MDSNLHLQENAMQTYKDPLTEKFLTTECLKLQMHFCASFMAPFDDILQRNLHMPQSNLQPSNLMKKKQFPFVTISEGLSVFFRSLIYYKLKRATDLT